jgi:hypothetical protein
MELSISLGSVNWLSVIVAGLVSFGIGSLWYTPVLFGKAWSKEVGINEEKARSANMPLIFGTSFVLQFIAALALDIFLGKDATVAGGLVAGGLISIGWVATSYGTTYLFSQKTLKLFLIDAGYYLVLFLSMGAILGAWK